MTSTMLGKYLPIVHPLQRMIDNLASKFLGEPVHTTPNGMLGKLLVSPLVLLLSLFIDKFKRVSRNAGLRKTFQNIQVLQSPNQSSNPHGYSAKQRANAKATVDNFITLVGYQRYDISPDKISHKGDSLRLFYQTRDVTQTCKLSTLDDTHVITMIDVDYYIDFPKLLLTFRPILIYTLVPSRPGRYGPDHMFSVTQNVVTQIFQGGSQYQHEIWDHKGCSFVKVTGGVNTCFTTYIYSVEMLKLDDDRYLVFYCPECSIPFGLGIWIQGSTLTRKRLTYGNGRYNAIRYVADQIDTVAFSYEGMHESYSVPTHILAVLKSRFEGKDALTYEIQQVIAKGTNTNPSTALTTAVQDWLRHPDKFPITLAPQYPTVFMTDRSDNYAFINPVFEENMRPSMWAVCDSVFPHFPAFAPMRCQANEAATIQGRIRNLTNNTRPNMQMMQHMKEFVTLLIPADEVHRLHPYTLDMVLDRQKRPSQRATYRQRKDILDVMDTTFQCFQKAEAYLKLTDPRNIVCPSVDLRTKYSEYTYALTDMHYKHQSWYAFSKDPKTLSREVMEIAEGAPYLEQGDYARWDGSQCPITKLLFQMILLRAFHPDYHDDLKQFIRTSVNHNAYTALGQKFTTGWMTITGNPDTSTFNTTGNAFCSFHAARLNGLNPDDAWHELGLYGGDDSINRPLIAVKLQQAAKQMGLTLESDRRTAHSSVNFLGRCFLNPWTRPHSICDLKRTLARFHLSSVATRDAGPQAVLRRKAEAWLVTDPNTPIIGQLCRGIIESTQALTDKERKLTEVESRFWTHFDAPFEVPNYDDDEMWIVAADNLDVDLTSLRDIEKTPDYQINQNENMPPHAYDVLWKGEIWYIHDKPVCPDATAMTVEPMDFDDGMRPRSPSPIRKIDSSDDESDDDSADSPRPPPKVNAKAKTPVPKATKKNPGVGTVTVPLPKVPTELRDRYFAIINKYTEKHANTSMAVKRQVAAHLGYYPAGRYCDLDVKALEDSITPPETTQPPPKRTKTQLKQAKPVAHVRKKTTPSKAATSSPAKASKPTPTQPKETSGSDTRRD